MGGKRGEQGIIKGRGENAELFQMLFLGQDNEERKALLITTLEKAPL